MRVTSPLSVGELVRSGPLAQARLLGNAELGGEVHSVRLLDDAAIAAPGMAHAALVLTDRAARGGWTVEATVRTAWERAAACVVIPESAAALSTELVASRLAVPVLAVTRGTHDVGLELAAAIARPDAARATVTARCALRLVEAGSSARPLVGVLNSELPGVEVALLSPSGAVAAGRSNAAQAWRDSAAVVAAETGGSNGGLATNRMVTAAVSGPGGRELGRLVAVSQSYSFAWAATVRGVLRIAAGLLSGWAAATRLEAEREPRNAAVALRRILAGTATEEEPDAETHPELRLAAWGWPTGGSLVAVAVVPCSAQLGGESVVDLSRELNAVWANHLDGTLVPYIDGWVCCRSASGRSGARSRLARQVSAALEAAAPLVDLVAGVGEVTDTEHSAFAATVRSAWEAARDARSYGPGTVVHAGSLGPRRILAGIPTELTDPAREVLADVLAVDSDGALVATLATVLDHGGSVQEAAARLGVHRNTVTARLDRLRGLGVDPHEPGQRLALHLACHMLRGSA